MQMIKWKIIYSGIWTIVEELKYILQTLTSSQ